MPVHREGGRKFEIRNPKWAGGRALPQRTVFTGLGNHRLSSSSTEPEMPRP
jgi:hypothetical protein